jgi:hypothetical protein
MAHFAELDINNKVIRVLTACNQDIANNGGELSEQAALHFQSLNKFSESGVKWVQTSYNNNFRKQYAGVGYSYLPEENVFILPKPFPSWSLNSNFDWQAPIAYPTVLTYGDNAPYWGTYWDESNQRWLTFDDQNNKFAWIPESSSWISTGE